MLARDEHGLVELLTADAREISDGGGKVTAALNPIESASRVARFILGLARKYNEHFSIEHVIVNFEPGLILWIHGAPVVAAFETDGTHIKRTFHILNPDKLTGVHPVVG